MVVLYNCYEYKLWGKFFMKNFVMYLCLISLVCLYADDKNVSSESFDASQLEQLKKGSENWNMWRVAHPHAQVNLQKADLSASDLSNANLKNANLSGANLAKANLAKADLQQANLSNANLDDANLTNVNAIGAKFDGATLNNANFSGGLFHRASFVAVSMKKFSAVHGSFIGADFSKADLTDGNFYMAYCMGILAEDCNFENVNTFYCNLAGIRFGEKTPETEEGKVRVGWSDMPVIDYNKEQCALIEKGAEKWNEWRAKNPKVTISFRGAKLANANFDNFDLRGARFEGATLTEASFQNANLEKATFAGASIQKGKFNNANLTYTNLEGCDLQWVILDNANIENTALLGSNLAWASVTGIDPEKLKKATTAATLK